MAYSRYTRTPIIGAGRQYGTSYASTIINKAVNGGTLSFKTHVTRSDERLDIIAGRFYGHAGYWWVIAAASGIGWGLQVPPGIMLKIPDLGGVTGLVG